jgi:CRP/FNR family transcriptional regulator, cyclic AMP receptor protein
MHQGSGQKAAWHGRPSEKWLEEAFVEGDELRDLSHTLWAGIDAISSPETFGKGTVLFVEGQKPLGVFIVRKGLVKLSASSADGKSLIVGRAAHGNMLGLPTTVSGKVNELTAEAAQLVECGFVARETFLQFLQRNGNAALRVAEILSHMYDDAFDQVRYLGLSSTAPEKLARLLLELPGHESPNNGHAKTLPHTHEEIAEMIGASRETVTRLFARFKKEQLVRVKGSRLHILDRAALEQLLTQ